VTELGLPDQVALAVGEERRFRLPGLGSAGYTWDVRVEGPEGVVSTARASAGGTAEVRSAQGPLRREAGSVDEEVTIRGETPGEVILSLAQRRPWEQEEPPRLEATVRILVS
jgi:hypothetical protein